MSDRAEQMKPGFACVQAGDAEFADEFGDVEDGAEMCPVTFNRCLLHAPVGSIPPNRLCLLCGVTVKGHRVAAHDHVINFVFFE